MPKAPDAPSRPEGRSPFLAIGLLAAVYFATRIGSLRTLPIFLDEAVHIQWAERLFSEGRILRPVGSGRLLAVAAYGLALPFEDRLGAARFMASLAGGATLVFTMLLSHRLFGSRASAIAGALYVLSPFALVYDRLALSDGFLSACVAALLFAAWRLVQQPAAWSRRLAVTVLALLAIVSKVSALLFFLGVPLAAAASAPDRRAALRAVMVAAALGLLCASPMLWFFAVNSGEVATQHMVDPAVAGATVATTLLNMRDWVSSYFSIPALVAGLVSLLLLRDGRALWLGGSVVLPFVLFGLFSQPWSARYVLPTLPPFLVLISGGIERLSSRFPPPRFALAACALTTIASLSYFSFDLALLLDPARAPLPLDDRLQLVTGWPAGYGVVDLAARLKREAEGGALLVYVDSGGTRTLSSDLSALLGGSPGIRLVEGDFESESFQGSMVPGPPGSRAFAALSPRLSDFDFKSRLENAAAEKIEAYQRPGGEWAGTLFRLRPPAERLPSAGLDGRVF